MIHQFDCCFATYEGVDETAKHNGSPVEVNPADKIRSPVTRFFAGRSDVLKFLIRKGVTSDWLCVYRDYVRATDQRTAISAVVPCSVPIQPLNGFTIPHGNAVQYSWALAAINSFAYDFIAKQKTPGQHFNVTTMSQVPIPELDEKWLSMVIRGVAELSYIVPELNGFATELGIDGPPFDWIQSRRDLIRCELDSIFSHLYGLEHSDVSYIMDTFSIIKRRDIQHHGSFRTKELILELHEKIAEAISADRPYQTVLDPPPGHGPRRPAR